MKNHQARPTKTVRVKLNRRNLVTFGLLMSCSCGERHWISDKGSYVPDVWSCVVCGRPLVAIGFDGKMHFVGQQAMQRGVDDVSGC